MFSGSSDRMALFPVGPNSNKGKEGETRYFLALCVSIAKTVRHTTKVTINDYNRKLHGLSIGTKVDDLG